MQKKKAMGCGEQTYITRHQVDGQEIEDTHATPPGAEL